MSLPRRRSSAGSAPIASRTPWTSLVASESLTAPWSAVDYDMRTRERTIVKDVSEYLFRERNIYVPADKFGLWVVPPLIVTRSELDWVCEGLDAALTVADRALI